MKDALYKNIPRIMNCNWVLLWTLFTTIHNEWDKVYVHSLQNILGLPEIMNMPTCKS